MKKYSLTRLARLSIVASVYVVLTLVFGFMSFGGIQFRIAEALMLLCFYKKDYGASLIVGCLIANMFSPMAALDMVFGTLATAIAVLLIYISPNIYVASLAPVITNAFIIAAELKYAFDLPYWLSVFQVAFGEFICVTILGVILFKSLEKNRRFMELITK